MDHLGCTYWSYLCKLGISSLSFYSLDWSLQFDLAGRRLDRRSVAFPLVARSGVDNGSAGITVGAVVVPQSMAYAKLALLPPQFGLYSSFMGVLIYWFFATSKDITIGVSNKSGSLSVVLC